MEGSFEVEESGSWGDVVEFCSRLERALDGLVSEEALKRFSRWRPRDGEEREELHERTAREESLDETSIEKNSEGVRKELHNARNEVQKGGKELAHAKPVKGMREAEKAGGSTLRGLLPPLFRLARRLENLIYRRVMERTSPQYFESEEFTVSIERGMRDRDSFALQAVFKREELIEKVRSRI